MGWNKEFQNLKIKYRRFRIGLRTVKTAAAVIIAMAIITYFSPGSNKMIFGMLGAMASMEHTFKGSVEACLTQIVGLTLGAVLGMGLVLLPLPIPRLMKAGIGIILVITSYNGFRIRYSPALPCLIVVTMTTITDIVPLEYALGRLWASGIGLLVGLVINTLVFPYDNSNKIRAAIDYLDRELLLFLKERFDGNGGQPDTEKMSEMIDDMRHQLKIFSGQSFILRKTKKRRQLEIFKTCVGKERQLIAHMVVLSRLKHPGRLNEKNRERLLKYGADIPCEGTEDSTQDQDVVTNYHVEQLLRLRLELMDELKIILDL